MPIRTPDQRLRVFVSSTLQELAEERRAARSAIERLHLSPVLFELGARPHPPRELYRAYLAQSDVFVGIYWERYGWVAPGETVSGLEDEYRLSGTRPKLIYVKTPAAQREARLAGLIEQIQRDDQASYRPFAGAEELRELLENDLALLLTERFDLARAGAGPQPQDAPPEVPPPPAPLPQPLTSLVGREAQLQRIGALLARPGVRLVTLLGPGGIGKTRLALEVARRALAEGRYAGGVRFVGLANVREREGFAAALAHALRLPERADRPALDSVQDALRGQRLLLLLDNFEQMQGAAPDVAGLLAGLPDLQILVTSRAALRLSAEQEWPVPPLELPQGDGEQDAQGSEAVALFVERARAVRPDFEITRQNLPALLAIVRRLEGIPLAIELAAARLRTSTPELLAARLARGLDWLGGGPSDVPERQRTLRATLDWSYQLLSLPEQALLRRLGVFVGGASPEAVEGVCGEACREVGGTGDALDALERLVDHSLARQEEREDEVRFSLLQSVREYALAGLAAHGEEEAARAAHAAAFLKFTEATVPLLFGPEQLAALHRLDRDAGNVRAALHWLQAHDLEAAQRLTACLRWYWDARGLFSEGRQESAAVLGGAGTPPLVRAGALLASGMMAWRQGDYAGALPQLEEALGLARSSGDRRLVAASLQLLGNLAAHQGRSGDARAAHKEALALRRELGDPRGVADSLFSLGNVALLRGELAEARPLYQQSLTGFQEVGDRASAGFALMNLGVVARFEGNFALARTLTGDALEVARTLGDRLRVANALQSLGLIAADEGDNAEAGHFLEEALALYRACGHRYKAAFVLSELATALRRSGELGRARTLYEEGLRAHRELGDGPGLAFALVGLAQLEREEGRLDRAGDLLREGVPLALDRADGTTAARALEALAALRVAQGWPERGARLFGAAETLRETAGIPLPPAAQQLRARETAAARQALGGARFAVLFAEGCALTPAQVLAEESLTPAASSESASGSRPAQAEHTPA
ncbi:tetratricopeptide repeat protein [Deinococcus budaensis]|nr:tetratricopeptide repeat protein [Deinococcus budaensis]